MSANERKGVNQKLKMLYLVKLFYEETDDLHALTMPEIIEKLAAFGVNADRKTLYQDFEELRRFGLDILDNRKGHSCYYHLASRKFELPELKLLVDSVQSSKFITDKKSQQLIRKIEALASKHEGKLLHRQVVITGRVKTMNESIYYNVDKLHEAISSGCQIRFQYFQWNIRKEQELRHGGAWYRISPWALMWDNENYYLVGYDPANDQIRHYRVDKMLNITVTKEPREGQMQFKAFDMPRYSKSLFGMFGGDQISVTLEAKNYMANVLIDRFGRDIILIPQDPDHIRTTVTVALSGQFFGWIMALGDGIKIIAPDTAARQMKKEIQRLTAQYFPDQG